MQIKKINAVYFSATGTTEKIIKVITKNIEKKYTDQIQYFDFTLPEKRNIEIKFNEYDLVIIATPVYAGRVPNILISYIKNNIKGNRTLAIPLVVYGNRNYDDALIELCNILKENNFHTIAAAAFIGEHAFSKTLAKDRPDENDIQIARLFSDKIYDYVLNLKEIPKNNVEVKGETPIRPYYIPRDRNGKLINILKVVSKVKDSCTKCGLCAKVCPMGSIDKNDVTKYKGICIKCGACVKKCPEQSRYYDDEGYLYHLKELEESLSIRKEPELFFINI